MKRFPSAVVSTVKLGKILFTEILAVFANNLSIATTCNAFLMCGFSTIHLISK